MSTISVLLLANKVFDFFAPCKWELRRKEILRNGMDADASNRLAAFFIDAYLKRSKTKRKEIDSRNLFLSITVHRSIDRSIDQVSKREREMITNNAIASRL